MGLKTNSLQIVGGPIDEASEWKSIYAQLEKMIGAPAAKSWFANVRFVRLQSDTLELSHWGSFSAKQVLRRFGKQLCEAAKVSTVRMNHSGGFHPSNVEQTNQRGYETFSIKNVPYVSRETNDAA